MVVNTKNLINPLLYDFSDTAEAKKSSDNLKDESNKCSNGNSDSSNGIHFSTVPSNEDRATAGKVSDVIASINTVGALGLGSVSEMNNPNSSSFTTKVCSISKDPKAYASFLFNSFTSSGLYCTSSGGVTLDLHALLRVFIGEKDALNNAEFNVKMLNDISLIIGDAVSTYNSKRPDKSKLLLEIDNISTTVHLNRKLHYSDVEELISYVNPKDIDERVKIECGKMRAIKNIMSTNLS